MPHLLAKRTISSLTCTANSLVGTRIKARGNGFEPLRIPLIMGSAYAAVLPDPVSADAIMSCPARMAGMVFA